MIVDSGASGTVIGENMVRAVDATDVRSDITYKLGDGSKVPHMGDKSVHCLHGQCTHQADGRISH